MLTGKLQSKLLDFEDLGPVIGMLPSTRVSSTKKAPSSPPAAEAAEAAKTSAAPKSSRPHASSKVLPTAVLDLAKLKSMNADVAYSASNIRHVKELPLDKGSVHVVLKSGVLQLDPISLGVAGGSKIGRAHV